MNKKIYFAVALAAMAMTSCSVNDSVSDDPNAIPEVAYNTTSLVGTRESAGSTFDARSTNSRTITNLQNWTVEWNNGSTRLFGTSTTGLDLDIDRIAFLSTTSGNDWDFLQNNLNRQVFQWNSWDVAQHGGVHGELPSDRCCAEFVTSQRPEGQPYEGLIPSVEYHGYYFLPYFKDNRLPLVNVPEAYKEQMKNLGYDTRTINIGDWHLNDHEPLTVQRFLAENDFLQAYAHGGHYETIMPGRDGIFNTQTDSYDLAIDMRHAMALVEIELEIVEPTTDEGKVLPLNVIKLVAQDASNQEVKAFDVYAGLDSNGAWTFPTTDGISTPVKPGILISTTRNENTSTYNYMKSKGYTSLKYYMLVRQPASADHYELQVFSGTNFKPINFYPSSGFAFEPGKVYQFKLRCNLKNASTGYDWMTDGEITPLAPYNGQGSFWGE